mmetsp:Transcript_17935/g.60155  ORF Transcript_17935/g.60155 Transcript_17935/m.60155 type:complete len:205 (-) Transcript_17935:239-853(-)
MHAAHATIGDHHRVRRPARVVPLRRRTLLHDRQHLCAADQLPKADVLARQARDVAEREEELRCVRVFAAVAHGEHPSLAQLHLEPCGIVLEALLLAGEDALATTPIVLDKVAALRHKALDAAVEVAALVGHLAPRLLALASVAEQQRHKVLDRQRRNLWPHLDVDALRRHLHGAAASAAPLEIVGVQLLLDALELGTAKLRQPV